MADDVHIADDIDVAFDVPVPFDVPVSVHGIAPAPAPAPPHKRPFVEHFAHFSVESTAQPELLAAPVQELSPAPAPQPALAKLIGPVISSVSIHVHVHVLLVEPESFLCYSTRGLNQI